MKIVTHKLWLCYMKIWWCPSTFATNCGIQYKVNTKRRESKDTEAIGRYNAINQARSKPDPVVWHVRTARTILHHYNSKQYYSTQTVLLIVPFIQTNVTSQMRPSGRKLYHKQVVQCNTNRMISTVFQRPNLTNMKQLLIKCTTGLSSTAIMLVNCA